MALEDDEQAVISKKDVEIVDRNGVAVKRKPNTMTSETSKISKEGHEYFMLKDIFEQPRVLEDTIQAYVNLSDNHFSCNEECIYPHFQKYPACSCLYYIQPFFYRFNT